MDKFIVNFNVFRVGKTFEDWLKSDEDDGTTKAKNKAKDTRFRDLTDDEEWWGIWGLIDRNKRGLLFEEDELKKSIHLISMAYE